MDRADQAVRITAAAGVIRDMIAAQSLPLDRDAFQRYLQQARDRMSPDAWAVAWDEGCKMSTEEVITLALE